MRTPRGRRSPRRAYEHLGLPPPASEARRARRARCSEPPSSPRDTCERAAESAARYAHQAREVEVGAEDGTARAAHAHAPSSPRRPVMRSVPPGRWTGVSRPGGRRSSRQAATTVAHAPVPHASVMPQPRSQTTRSISPLAGARMRELDVGAAREAWPISSSGPERLGQRAQFGAGSSTKITACGLPIETRGEAEASCRAR